MNLYTIYDAVAEEFGPLFEAKNNGVAIRNYNKLMAENNISEGYELYLVGTFTHEDGTITSDNTITKITVEKE